MGTAVTFIMSNPLQSVSLMTITYLKTYFSCTHAPEHGFLTGTRRLHYDSVTIYEPAVNTVSWAYSCIGKVYQNKSSEGRKMDWHLVIDVWYIHNIKLYTYGNAVVIDWYCYFRKF